jgi:hypothetical protein
VPRPLLSFRAQLDKKSVKTGILESPPSPAPIDTTLANAEMEEAGRQRLRCKNIEKFPEHYNAAVELNRLAHRYRDGITGAAKESLDVPVTIALVIRAIDSLQGAIVLFEVGLSAEASTLIRSALECVFALGAMAGGVPVRNQFDRAHNWARKSWAFSQKDVTGAGRLDDTTIATICAATVDVKKFDINFRELAKAAGLENVYIALYKPISHFGVHASAGSLTGALGGTDDQSQKFVLTMIIQGYGYLLSQAPRVCSVAGIVDEASSILAKLAT